MSPRSALALTLACASLGAACSSSSNVPAVRPDAAVADAASDGDASARDAAADGAAVDGASTRSAGCGAPPTQGLAQYILHTEVVSNVAPAYAATATNREYWLRLPTGYDPDRAYPTVFIGPGCGETGHASIPLEDVSGTDAILVGMNGVGNCFNHDAADTPDLPYFDATLAAVEAEACVDTSHVFVMGYSSGSWLTSYLGCARGNLIRAQATVAGGLPPIPATCTGPIPAMYVRDTDDSSTMSGPIMMAVERVRVANGCSTTTTPYDPGTPPGAPGGAMPCVQYQGCMPGFPLVFCQTMGLGHSDQSADTHLSTIGFWRFWSSLSSSR